MYVVLECVQHIHDRPCVRIYYPSFAVGGNASASRSPLCGMIVFPTRHQRVVSGTLNMPARHSVQESCSLQLQKNMSKTELSCTRVFSGHMGETVLKVKVPPVRIENSLSPLYRGTDFSTLAETFQTVWGGTEGVRLRGV